MTGKSRDVHHVVVDTVIDDLLDAAGRPLPTVSDATAERIQRSLQASLRPVSARPPLAVIAGQLVVALVASVLVATALRGLDGWHAMTLAQRVAMSIALGAGALLLCTSATWRLIPGSLPRFGAAAAGAIAVSAFVLAIVALFPPRASGPFVAEGVRCLYTGVLMAVPVALVCWMLVRQSTVEPLRQQGEMLGAIAGLAAVAILQFSCNRQQTDHLLVWHGAVWAVTAIGGLMIGRAVDRSQSVSSGERA